MSTPSIRLANAPVSWGVNEGATWARGEGWAIVLDEIAQAGYEGTELGDFGFLPTDPAHLRAELAARGLQMVGTFLLANLHVAEAHETAEAEALRNGRLVAETGGRYLNLCEVGDSRRWQSAGRVTPDMMLTDEQWKIVAEGTNRIARTVREQLGLETVFHHHAGTFVETPEELDRLMALTDPELVGLLLDTGHFLYGGGDPREALRRYGRRVRYLHFKDLSLTRLEEARSRGLSFHDAVAFGVFTELGQGDVDFPGLLKDLGALGYEGWACVEQDIVPGTGIVPLESARRSREYLRTLGL